MRIAYADPPYMGCSSYYPEHEEVDHTKLIEELCWGDRHYDGWALSCKSSSVRVLLNHNLIQKRFDTGVIRLAAWVKPWASFKPNVNPAYAWEPVIFKPARVKRSRELDTVRDWCAANITMKKGIVGAKPPQFCYWLFDLIGMEPEDELDDLYPGTGIVTKCWADWKDMKNNTPITLNMTMKEG